MADRNRQVSTPWEPPPPPLLIKQHNISNFKFNPYLESKSGHHENQVERSHYLGRFRDAGGRKARKWQNNKCLSGVYRGKIQQTWREPEDYLPWLVLLWHLPKTRIRRSKTMDEEESVHTLVTPPVVVSPLCGKNHWTLVAADFRAKTIKYYDSMGEYNKKFWKCY